MTTNTIFRAESYVRYLEVEIYRFYEASSKMNWFWRYKSTNTIMSPQKQRYVGSYISEKLWFLHRHTRQTRNTIFNRSGVKIVPTARHCKCFAYTRSRGPKDQQRLSLRARRSAFDNQFKVTNSSLVGQLSRRTDVSMLTDPRILIEFSCIFIYYNFFFWKIVDYILKLLLTNLSDLFEMDDVEW